MKEKQNYLRIKKKQMKSQRKIIGGKFKNVSKSKIEDKK